MVKFSDCKINIGLNVLRRRPDGYHDIETCMVHVPWCDVIEILPTTEPETTLTVLGNAVDCPPEKNLVIKAYNALKAIYELPPVEIVLQKVIPDGAGLGGGSSDATHTIEALNEVYSLALDRSQIAEISSKIGADCAFFAYQEPMIAEGIGERLTPIHLDLSGYTILIAKPSGVSISTREAYAGVTPSVPAAPLSQLLARPIEEWQGLVKNDFEASIFPLAPQVAALKKHILESGAVYASMSGSGASVYGIFRDDKMAERAQTQLEEIPNFMFSL